MSKEINNIIILDNHIQGLGCIRLTVNKKVRVILYNSSKICVSRFSKYCHELKVYKNQEYLLNELLTKQSEGSLIIPTNDKMIKFCLDNYNELSAKFKLLVLDYKNTELCYSKKLLYQRLANSNISLPETDYACHEFDYKEYAKKVRYPVILKPSIMHTFKSELGKKVLLCENQREFNEKYLIAKRVIPEEEIMIQELIKGGAKNLFSYCAFAVNGKPYGEIIVNRKRQNPMDFGNSTTYAITVDNDRVKCLAESLLNEIHYTGMCEVEFMYDEESDTYKFLEINPRFWKWHNLAQKMKINYLEMYLQYVSGIKISDKRYVPYIVWRERISDTIIALNEILKGKLSFKDFNKSNRYCTQYACWDKKDPLPAIMYMLFLPILKIKRK